METRSVVASLSALAQDTRLAIFKLLAQTGSDGLPAGQIGDQLGIQPSSISFHIKELSHAGLVQSRQESRFIIYTANYPAMTNLMDYLMENCCAYSTEPDATPIEIAAASVCLKP